MIAGFLSLAYLYWGTEIIAMLTLLPEVRTVADEYLPWIAAAPIVAVWAFMLDGVFIGTTRTRELRNSMFFAAVVYLLAVWMSLEPLQNHGIWLSMTVFMAMRAILLGALYPRIERLAARAGRGDVAPAGSGLSHRETFSLGHLTQRPCLSASGTTVTGVVFRKAGRVRHIPSTECPLSDNNRLRPDMV